MSEPVLLARATVTVVPVEMTSGRQLQQLRGDRQVRVASTASSPSRLREARPAAGVALSSVAGPPIYGC